jgi:CRISPR-associated protein Csm3
VRFVVDILCDEDKVLPALLLEGLRLLEDDSLGGGGSRGSGQVSFGHLRLAWRGRSYYASGSKEAELIADSDLSALQSLVNEPEFPSRLTQ